MKKRLIYIFGIFFMISACGIEEPESRYDHLELDFTVTSDLYATRAVKTDWESGDRLFLVFDSYYSVSEESTKALILTLTFNGTSWDGSFSDPALEQYLLGRESGLLAAAYIPYEDIEFEYSPTWGITRVSGRPSVYSYYLTAKKVPYTVSGGKLTASIAMTLSSFVHFYLPDMQESPDMRYTLKCEDLLASRCGPTGTGTTYPSWGAISVSFGYPLTGMRYKGGLSFSGILNSSSNGVSKEYVLVVTDTKGTSTTDDDVTYTLTKTATLNYKDAVSLPPLSNPAWVVKKPQSEMFGDWGLEGTFVSYVSNERPYEWYIDQGSTGACSGVNCGPASSTMAAHWYDSSFTGTTEEARSEFYNNGGWWYTNDINAYFTNHGIAHSQRTYRTNDDVTSQIDRGNIVLLCLDMYYITYGNVSGKRVNKFYKTAGTGWGHFLLVKGYVRTSTMLYYEVYDPYSMGRTYPDGSPLGKDRYYDAAEILNSAGIWWPNMITIGGN